VSVNAEATPDTVSVSNPTSTLEAITGGNGNIISYAWTPPGTLSNPNAQQTEATPTETTVYTVTVTTQDGCIATDSVTVFYRESACVEPYVFIPKAFTPNNDFLNDYFIVRADGMTALKFIVWNRWGEIVYETDDPSAQGWDGTFKGKEAVGDAFAWYVRLVCANEEVYVSKGNVFLLK
jgi:gliding motility-associated-like protein